MFRVIHYIAGILCLVPLIQPKAYGDEQSRKAIAVIPEGREKFSSSFEGTYYIRRVLKNRHDKATERISTIESEIRKGVLKASAAKVELAELRLELKQVKRLIEKDKVLVSPFKIHTDEVDGAIKLGANRLLVIHADKVKLVGWDKPYARFLLRRIQLSAEKLDKELNEKISVEHKHGSFPQFVGYTAAERKAQEEKFQASPNGQKLTSKQQEGRLKMLARSAGQYRGFEQFQGKEFDSLKLLGLTAQEGNRQIQYELRTPQGARSMGSRWRNNAELTVFVPKCQAVLVRGCEVGLDIMGLKSDVILSNAGATNRDYHGTFVIRDLQGKFSATNVPLDVVSGVSGDVNIVSTTEMVNNGTQHSGGFRTAYTPKPRYCEISNVRGNVTATFTRSDLSIKNVSGVLNIQNEFGDTECTINALMKEAAHRIVSLSGRVRVVQDKEVKLGVKLFIATSCGTARTNLGRDMLDDMSSTHTSELDSQRRQWRSFFTPVGNDFMAKFGLYSRPDQTLADLDRSAGLDIISRSGHVEFVRE
jgi:hypothetical protein